MIPEIDKTLSSFWERFKHPILGAFASAWVIINWEVVYTLLCGIKDYGLAISEINSQYFIQSRVNQLFWYPFWSTVVFVLVGPWLRNAYVSWLVLTVTVRQFVDDKIKGLEPVTKHAHGILQGELRSAQSERDTWRNAYNATNTPERFFVGSAGNKIEIKDFVQTYETWHLQTQDLHNQINKLKAELLDCKNKK